MTLDEWIYTVKHEGLDGITNKVDATVELVELLEELKIRREAEQWLKVRGRGSNCR